ncbi:MAG: MutT-like protein [Pseudolabrys sp.]|jgi:predicted NUDIX family NTP pyrophosphohydrolase|nr:MutT-like protein [Pseudolabrys sp.]
MTKTSAGLLLWRYKTSDVQVLLVHPGGPFWAGKDNGAWSIPKGEYDAGEDPLTAAQREFGEELGAQAPQHATPLGEIKQKGGKVVTGFAAQGDFDVSALRSNSFEMEWPPHSGRRQAFPEVDRAQWFGLAEARNKINSAQCALLDRLDALITSSRPKRRSDRC